LFALRLRAFARDLFGVATIPLHLLAKILRRLASLRLRNCGVLSYQFFKKTEAPFHQLRVFCNTELQFPQPKCNFFDPRVQFLQPKTRTFAN
jgi:hypothetical protein